MSKCYCERCMTDDKYDRIESLFYVEEKSIDSVKKKKQSKREIKYVMRTGLHADFHYAAVGHPAITTTRSLIAWVSDSTTSS